MSVALKSDIATWEYEGGALAPAHEEGVNELHGQRSISVTVHDHGGRSASYLLSACSFRTAIQRAAVWFAAAGLRGPKPDRDTVYELSIAGDPRKWRMCGGTVLRIQ